MKKNKILLVMMAFALVVLAGCNSDSKTIDGVEMAAAVDGVGIPQKIFDIYYGIQRDNLVSQTGEEGLNQPMDRLNRTTGEILRENILDSLISNQVIINAAQEEDLGDIDTKVDEQIQTEKDMTGEDFFNQNLEYLGVTEDEYKDLLRNNIIVTEYRNKKMAEYEVTDEEIQTYYDENSEDMLQAQARHILVETEEEANNVLQRLEGGEDFAELATELSQDPGSAARGGDLGFFPKGTMIQEFEDFVFNAEVGEISEPIETQFGYHVIEVTDFKDSLEDYTEEIRTQIQGEKFVADMEERESNAKIEKFYDVSEEPESIKQRLEEQANQPAETPVEGETAPVEGETVPVEEEVAPAEGEEVPATEEAPVEGEEQPAESQNP